MFDFSLSRFLPTQCCAVQYVNWSAQRLSVGAQRSHGGEYRMHLELYVSNSFL